MIPKIITGYKGRYKYAGDTIYLRFKVKRQPPMQGYVIRAGYYLSQYFRDDRRRMFLRIWRPLGHWNF